MEREDTSCVEIKGKFYCAYCGKEISPDRTYDEYDEIRFYHCDCEKAKQEMKINKEIRLLKSKISALESTLPKQEFKAVTRTILEKIS